VGLDLDLEVAVGELALLLESSSGSSSMFFICYGKKCG
jgi:hypothetical protein